MNGRYISSNTSDNQVVNFVTLIENGNQRKPIKSTINLNYQY